MDIKSMISSIKNFGINFGGINQTNTNITLNNTSINATVNLVKINFYDCKFKLSFESLNKLITENNDNISVKFQLLLLKAKFYLSLSEILKFQKILNNLKENYSKLTSSKEFENLWLVNLSVENKENDFLSLALKISSEQDIEYDYLRIIYYVNTNDYKNAQSVLESHLENNKILPDSWNFIAGNIYTSLFNTSLSINNSPNYHYLDKAHKYFNNCMKMSDLTRFIKIEILISKLSYPLYCKNNSLAASDKYKKTIDDAEIAFDSILIESNYYHDSKKEIIINHLANIKLLYNKNDEFIFICKNNLDILDSINQAYYYLIVDNLSISAIIQLNLPKDKEENLITSFILKLFHQEDYKLIVQIIEDNNLKNLNAEIFSIYIQACLIEKKDLKKDNIDKLKNEKDNSIISYKLFLVFSHYHNIEIDEEELVNKIEDMKKENLSYKFILNLFRILLDLNKEIIAYNLIVFYKKKFDNNLLTGTFKILDTNKRINLYNLKKFLSEIENDCDSMNSYIGNIYLSFGDNYNSFIYLTKVWKLNKTLELAKTLFTIILNLKISLYHNNSIEEDRILKEIEYYLLKTDEIYFKLLLILNKFKEENIFEAIIFFNHTILESNINDIKENEYSIINQIFTLKSNHNENSFLDNTLNLLIDNNGTKVINSHYDINPTVNEVFEFTQASFTGLELLKSKNNKKSLFDYLILYFVQSNNVVYNDSIENSLNKIKEELKESNKQINVQIKKHNNEQDKTPLTFYSIISSYERYPSIINYSVYNKNNIFFTGLNIPFGNKKLLTFSSIIFLKSLDLLRETLSHNDIYIQSSIKNWITEHIIELTQQDKESLSVFYDSNSDSLYKEENTNRDDKKKYWLDILEVITNFDEKKRLINDHSSVLPFKDLKSTFIEYWGIFDYHALAFSLENNYQIISEDNMHFKFIEGFNDNKWNHVPPTNSSFIIQSLNDRIKAIDLIFQLHKNNYKYIINEKYASEMITESIISRKNYYYCEQETLSLSRILLIIDDYGWLKNMKSSLIKAPVLISNLNFNLETSFKKIDDIIKFSKNNI